MLLFHGTTVENMKMILKKGFNYKKQIWDCSEEKTCFFTEEWLRKEHDIENDSEVLERGIAAALEQSRFALAIENPRDYRGAVLVFDSSKMSNKDDLEPDYSCENMEYCVSVYKPDMSALVGVYLMKEEESASRLFFLASTSYNEKLTRVSLSTLENALLDNLIQNEIGLPSEMYDAIEYEEYQQTEEMTKKAA